MAEIQSRQLQQKHAGVKRSKKLSTRVDLTPMVDLGFLLITFFVFTTSLAEPKVVKLAMPQEKNIKDSMPVSENNVLTLVLKNDTTVGYYFGTGVGGMKFTTYGSGLRDVIIQKQKAMEGIGAKPGDLMVLIKPMDTAIYKDVVAALDEMLITDVKTYMLLSVNNVEAKIANR